MANEFKILVNVTYKCHRYIQKEMCLPKNTEVVTYIYISQAWKRVWKNDNEVQNFHNIQLIGRGCKRVCR